MIFGYMRISTQKASQTTDRQKDTLQKYSTDNDFKFDEIIEERISGTIKADNRPEYSKLKEKLRKDDILVITDLDRLGRNADDVIMELKQLKLQGVKVVALDMPYMCDWNKANDSSIYDMVIDIVITIKAHMAQQEREKTVARINQGISAMPVIEGKKVSTKTGNAIGRPTSDVPQEFIKEYKKYKNGEYGKMSATNFAKMLGIGRSTMYKYQGIIEKEVIDVELINEYKNIITELEILFKKNEFDKIKYDKLNEAHNKVVNYRSKSMEKVTSQLNIDNPLKSKGKLILNEEVESLINRAIKLMDLYVNRFK